jgi:hypothetical protein
VSRRGQSGISDIALFGEYGLDITPARWAKEPSARADLLALLFSKRIETKDGELPALVFSPRAERAFDRCINYRFQDPIRKGVDAPERFLKRDDHLVDALGYVMSAVPDPLGLTQGDPVPPGWAALEKRLRLPTPEEMDDFAFRRPERIEVW